MYVSPMLSEVEERVPNELESLGFVFPTMEYDPEESSSSKSYSLLKKLKNRDNVAFSHSLFTDLTKAHLEEVRQGEYTLIIDEEVSFISAYVGKYKREDVITLLDNDWVEIQEENKGRVVWKDDNIQEKSQYHHFKEMCDMGQLFCSKGERMMLVTQLPMDLLSHSKETILITYMFEYSVMYSFLKLRGVKFEPLQSVYNDIQLLQDEEEWKRAARSLITISSTPNTEKVKKNRWLSKSWYDSNATREQLDEVGRAIDSVFRRYDHERILYTMPKQSAHRWMLGSSRKVRNNRCAIHRNTKVGEGYFLYSGARASNDYIHKDVAIHAYNRFPNLSVKAYLQDYGGDIDDDMFALSEMVQWVWRTGVRRGHPIHLFFLSQRMEDIFSSWLF